MDHVAGSFNTSAGSKKGGRFFNWGYQQPPRHRAQQWHKQKDMNASRRFNGFDCTVIEADSDCPRGSFSSPPPSGRSVSNLSHFLEHTTPTVASQLHSKSHGLSFFPNGCSKSFFFLRDLWESFDEWSAYGAGVPIVLNGKETVIQYYVPYLSAIQLYRSSITALCMKSRRLGDDSDCSEIEYRDSTSEASSDGETEKVVDQEVVSERVLPSGSHNVWSSLEAGQSAFPRGKDETLMFEYYELAAPSLRVPLYDKVGELACKYPGLKNLCSDDLSQSSWLSVAWYPIYRIPTGPTLRDLGASFLTYHSLSTLFTSGGKGTTTASQDFKDYQYSGGGKGTTIDSQDSMGSLNGSPIRLSPFGLASYKFRGAVWSCSGVVDRQRTSLLLRSSDEWLRGLGVYHPDFDYFMSHCYPARC